MEAAGGDEEMKTPRGGGSSTLAEPSLHALVDGLAHPPRDVTILTFWSTCSELSSGNY
jgi:hypothetical protein